MDRLACFIIGIIIGMILAVGLVIGIMLFSGYVEEKDAQDRAFIQKMYGEGGKRLDDLSMFEHNED